MIQSFNLFRDKRECSGCGACYSVCPRKAIKLVEDGCGFVYPQIEREKCVNCGLCKKVCNYQNNSIVGEPAVTYVGMGITPDLVRHSASGGVFAELATQFILKGGYVCGAAFDDKWNVKHIIINNCKDLFKIQGSKYVQSETGPCFHEIRSLLAKGEKVLFSGTPCQVDGLRGVLNSLNVSCEKLFTIDIICHGVPSSKMFHDFLHYQENKIGCEIVSFTFRDKRLGWGINGSVEYDSPNGIKKKKCWESSTSYVYYFKRGLIFRENCYYCKYACKNRPADITLGDFWGIEKVHPEYIGRNKWDENNGISVAIVNSKKGQALLNNYGQNIELKLSSFENAAMKNHNLLRPTPCPRGRAELLRRYECNGWQALEKSFKKLGWRRYTSQIKKMIPKRLKQLLKGL